MIVGGTTVTMPKRESETKARVAVKEDHLPAGKGDLCLGLGKTRTDLVQWAGEGLRCGPPLA